MGLGGEESRPPPGMGGLDTGRSGEPNAAADGDPVGVQEVGDGKGGERVDVWTRSQERRLGAVSKRSSTPMATTAELAELGRKENWDEIGWVCFREIV